MSRRWAFMALVRSGSPMLPACSSGQPASHSAIRVASVVHVGPNTQVFASPLPANPAPAAVVNGKPYVLRDVAAPPGLGSAKLTQFGSRVPPPASQVVNLSQLAG